MHVNTKIDVNYIVDLLLVSHAGCISACLPAASMTITNKGLSAVVLSLFEVAEQSQTSRVGIRAGVKSTCLLRVAQI